jgi:hypothetical protein
MEAGLDKPYVFKDINLKASDIKFELYIMRISKNRHDCVFKNYTVHCTQNLLQVALYHHSRYYRRKALQKNINRIKSNAKMKKISS